MQIIVCKYIYNSDVVYVLSIVSLQLIDLWKASPMWVCIRVVYRECIMYKIVVDYISLI